MNLKYPITLILLVIAFAGCTSNKCQVSCLGNIGMMVVGFTRAELDSGRSMAYKRNGEFNELVGSGPLKSPYWTYPTINDTTSDTLLNLVADFGDSYDYVLVIPVTGAANDTFIISHITLGGQRYATKHCRDGGTAYGFGCETPAYLESYSVNKVQVVTNGKFSSFYSKGNYIMGLVCIKK